MEMKDIQGYEGLYAITDQGQVWSYRKKKFLTPRLKHGYYQVHLTDRDGKLIDYAIHRLVAQAFIPNPENKPTVNHKDENGLNNDVSNLEWATYSEQVNYGTRNQRTAVANSIPVYCIELDKVFIGATVAAQEVGLSSGSTITQCCRNSKKTAAKYHWRYATKEEREALRNEMA